MATQGKTGRNDPCPCGSGKKYKKCCLSFPQGQPEAGGLPQASGASGGNRGLAMSPYVISKLGDDPLLAKATSRVTRRKLRAKWTPRKVANLSNVEIGKRLTQLGIDPSPEKFLPLTKGRTSAWGISDLWLRQLGPELNRDDDDFLGLAACELWKRYCAERPSVEMLDDWMQDGYQLDMKGCAGEACDIWLRVWNTLLLRFTPQMRTLDDATPVFQGTQCLSNWVQDFSMALHNASLRDPRFAEAGICSMREVLGQFPDENDDLRMNFSCDIATLHFRSGHEEEGERLFREIIRDRPDDAQGYVRLADELGAFRAAADTRPVNCDRAIALLEKALARPVTDADDWDLADRLEDLRRETGKPVSSDSDTPEP